MNEKEVEIYFENGRRGYCENNESSFNEIEERFGSKIIPQYKTGGKVEKMKNLFLLNGFTKDELQVIVEENPNYFSQIEFYDNQTLIVYRALELPRKLADKFIKLNKKEIGEGIGEYWTFDKNLQNAIWGDGQYEEETYLIQCKGYLYVSDIDWEMMKYAYDDDIYHFSQESEIRGVNGGNSIKVVECLEIANISFDKGGEITPNKPTETEIAERWDKKKNQIATLTDNIQRLRYNTTRNINGSNQNNSSSSEKNYLTSLVVCLMDETGERVGNEESASNGHFGITGLKKKHIKIEGNKVTLKYVGKSGVEHEVTFTNEKIANALKRAISNSVSDFVFETSEGFKIKADRVNRYLTDYNVTAKDLRGYSANKWVVDKLKNIDIADNEKERKKQFNEIVKKVANDIGHGRATLKNHYLLPNLEPLFIERGKILSLNEN